MDEWVRMMFEQEATLKTNISGHSKLLSRYVCTCTQMPKHDLEKRHSMDMLRVLFQLF
jgi:hypothetical protein